MLLQLHTVRAKLAISFGSLALVVAAVPGAALVALNDANSRFD